MRNQEFLHMYGSEWKKARAAFLREFPLCAECARTSRVYPANTVDHIINHKGDMVLFWDRNNWESLCRPCHSKKTAREDGSFGKGKLKFKPSKACKTDGTPSDSRHHWNKV